MRDIYCLCLLDSGRLTAEVCYGAHTRHTAFAVLSTPLWEWLMRECVQWLCLSEPQGGSFKTRTCASVGVPGQMELSFLDTLGKQTQAGPRDMSLLENMQVESEDEAPAVKNAAATIVLDLEVNQAGKKAPKVGQPCKASGAKKMKPTVPAPVVVGDDDDFYNDDDIDMIPGAKAATGAAPSSGTTDGAAAPAMTGTASPLVKRENEAIPPGQLARKQTPAVKAPAAQKLRTRASVSSSAWHKAVKEGKSKDEAKALAQEAVQDALQKGLVSDPPMSKTKAAAAKTAAAPKATAKQGAAPTTAAKAAPTATAKQGAAPTTAAKAAPKAAPAPQKKMTATKAMGKAAAKQNRARSEAEIARSGWQS